MKIVENRTRYTEVQAHCFHTLLENARSVGGAGNLAATIVLDDEFILVIVAGDFCSSVPNHTLPDFEQYEAFQVTLHDLTGEIVGVENCPALKGFANVIVKVNEIMPHVGIRVPTEIVMDMLVAADALPFEEFVH